MAAIPSGAYAAAGASPLLHPNSCLRVTSARFNFRVRASATTAGGSAASTGQQPSTPPAPSSNNGRLRNNSTTELEEKTVTIKDYMEWSKDMIGCGSEGGPPRWFSPLDCASPIKDSPLLLYLPGIDGVGLGLIKHHKRLGRPGAPG